MSLYKQDLSRCFETAIGKEGLTEAQWNSYKGAAPQAYAQLKKWKDSNELPLFNLFDSEEDLNLLRPLAQKLRSENDHVLVLGTGGSSLGAQALYNLVNDGFGLPAGQAALHFMDNVDPETFEALMQKLPADKTAVVSVSKSGTTAETLSQTVLLLEWISKSLGKDRLKDKVVVITEPKKSPLRDVAERFALPVFDHDPQIGGRFSVLSIVGLFPAMIAGIDVSAIRQGAKAVLEETLQATTAEDSQPMLGAIYAVAQEEQKDKKTSVLMPYADKLTVFGLWYRQLWAESLGKEGKGTTPVRAMGTVDQHSQVQLYLGGPADKFYTVIIKASEGKGSSFSSDYLQDESLSYLQNRTLGDLLYAEARATAETLARNGRPTRLLQVEKIDEEVLGALMMHFVLETVFAAELLKINAFDQPAVEEGKILTKQYMKELA